MIRADFAWVANVRYAITFKTFDFPLARSAIGQLRALIQLARIAHRFDG
jgi:hypothetical protein